MDSEELRRRRREVLGIRNDPRRRTEELKRLARDAERAAAGPADMEQVIVLWDLLALAHEDVQDWTAARRVRRKIVRHTDEALRRASFQASYHRAALAQTELDAGAPKAAEKQVVEAMRIGVFAGNLNQALGPVTEKLCDHLVRKARESPVMAKPPRRKPTSVLTLEQWRARIAQLARGFSTRKHGLARKVKEAQNLERETRASLDATVGPAQVVETMGLLYALYDRQGDHPNMLRTSRRIAREATRLLERLSFHASFSLTHYALDEFDHGSPTRGTQVVREACQAAAYIPEINPLLPPALKKAARRTKPRGR